MSIFKSTFSPSVKTQLDVRQKAMTNRTPQNLQYMNSRNAWIRLSSSVNVDGNNNLAKKHASQKKYIALGVMGWGVVCLWKLNLIFQVQNPEPGKGIEIDIPTLTQSTITLVNTLIFRQFVEHNMFGKFPDLLNNTFEHSNNSS